MAKGVYRISGVAIKAPPMGISIEKYNITNAARSADGKMKMDLIAKKRKFILKYEALSSQEVNLIESLVDSDAMFFDFEYPEDGVQKRATVYNGPIKKEPAWSDDWVWYWKDYELHLIEQ